MSAPPVDRSAAPSPPADARRLAPVRSWLRGGPASGGRVLVLVAGVFPLVAPLGIALLGSDGTRRPCPARLGCAPTPPLTLADLVAGPGALFDRFLYVAVVLAATSAALGAIAPDRGSPPIEREPDGPRAPGRSLAPVPIVALALVAAATIALVIGTGTVQPAIAWHGGATDGGGAGARRLLGTALLAAPIAAAVATAAAVLGRRRRSRRLAVVLVAALAPTVEFIGLTLDGTWAEGPSTSLPGFSVFRAVAVEPTTASAVGLVAVASIVLTVLVATRWPGGRR